VLGNRLVGTARVPVSDLVAGGSSGHVGYQVLWPDGKPNGTIQLWYRMEGSELPQDTAYSSPQSSAPLAADFPYKPPVEPSPVYPETIPGTVPFSSQLVSSGPVCYPPMPGLSAYNSKPCSGLYPPPPNSGLGDPGQASGRPTGTEYMPYLPPPSSGLYPPPADLGFGDTGRVSGTPTGMEYMPYPPPPSSGLYPPPPDSGFGSLVPSYPPPRIQDSLMDQNPGTSTYYPPLGTHYPPVNHGEGGSTYPPGTRHPPAMGSECCDSKYRDPREPVVAYPVGNGYYPPPPRYPYY
jgi:hypothetical protein